MYLILYEEWSYIMHIKQICSHWWGKHYMSRDHFFLTGLDAEEITEIEIQPAKEITMGRQEF